jgi:phosphoribosylformylglycinamidine cyclo-ligase
MFPVPPLFRTIQQQSGTDWQEMYKVFNMGHRLEVYVKPRGRCRASSTVSARASTSMRRVVGHIEEGPRSLTIKSEFGEFHY